MTARPRPPRPEKHHDLATARTPASQLRREGDHRRLQAAARDRPGRAEPVVESEEPVGPGELAGGVVPAPLVLEHEDPLPGEGPQPRVECRRIEAAPERVGDDLAAVGRAVALCVCEARHEPVDRVPQEDQALSREAAAESKELLLSPLAISLLQPWQAD